MKKISIIVPFKNTPIVWFKKLIDSLNEQSNKNFEAIFIDDNSDDSKTYKKLIQNNGYKYHLNNDDEYKGVGRLRDLGVKIAKYELIWFVDSDDWLTSDAVDYLLKSFDKYQDVDLIMFDYHWVFNLKKDSNKQIDQNNYKEYISKNEISKNNMKWFHNNYQTDWRVCFKKEFLINNNIEHRKNDYIFEDVYYGLIWKIKFKKILLSSKKIYYYNRLNNSSTLNNYKFKPEFLLKTLLDNKNYLIETSQFDEIWYFYCLNWIHALIQLKKTNMYNFGYKQVKEKLENKKTYTAKQIGINKYWIMNKISKLMSIYKK